MACLFEELRAQLEAAAVAHHGCLFWRARYSGDQVGLTRHGKGSKLQAIVGDNSLSLAIQMDSANPHEAHMAPALLEHLDELPALIVADKAYDTNALRDHVIERGSRMVVPHISNRKGPPRDQHHIVRHYKNRWRIERLFSWLAAWRRLATRWGSHRTTTVSPPSVFSTPVR